MTLEELKAQAYDAILMIEEGRAKLQETNAKIKKELERIKTESSNGVAKEKEVAEVLENI